MRRSRKILLVAAVVVVAVIAAAGGILYNTFYGVPAQFDVGFYAAPAADRSQPFSYDPYATVLGRHVDGKGMVAYAALKADRRLLDQFCRRIGWLDRETYDSWSRPAKIAFWINAYNALTLKAIVDHYPIRSGAIRSLAFPKSSIRQIPGVWDKVEFLAVGERMTLDQIEHAILRAKHGDPPRHKLVPDPPFDEPRIHLALVCAARGCPPLRREPYLGERLDAQLDDQARRFLTDREKFRIDRATGKVRLSSIFRWFGGDFVGLYNPATGFGDRAAEQRAVLNFIAARLDHDDAAYLRRGDYSVEYFDYDWTLNERPDLPPSSTPAEP